MSKFIDITGQQFNKLRVISLNRRSKQGTFWNCLCDCGNTTVVNGNKLKSGHTKTCGCSHKRNYVIGTPLYKAWCSMRGRTSKPNHKQYKHYGGRGITVCKEWQDSYETFQNWSLENGYAKGLSIDRIDNDKGYFPENCRWTTAKVQQNNRRANVFIEFNGKRQTIAQWADEIGINRKTLQSRLGIGGWTIEKALTESKGPTNSGNWKHITYNGETLTIGQWADRVGMHKSALHTRLRLGWDFEKAISTPLKYRAPKKKN